MNDLFHKIAVRISNLMGSPFAFLLAIVIVATWATTGPVFGFSTTWQLMINTFTTIATFLMVFLIQNTQNRDARAVHLKLDELIKGIKGARDNLVDLEEMTDKELDELQTQFRELHDKLQDRKEAGRPVNKEEFHLLNDVKDRLGNLLSGRKN